MYKCPRAVWSQKSENFTLENIERYVVYGDKIVKTSCQVLDMY